jgi:hypothetical protein
MYALTALICLGLCEIDAEHGPALDSPELESFFIENQSEIESAGRPCVDMIKAMRARVVH